MEAFLGIVCIVFGVLNLILFFKIWGMTNNVDRIHAYLTSAENDKHLSFLKHYTKDLTDILRELFGLETDVTISSYHESKKEYVWIEDYKFEISGFVYCKKGKQSESSKQVCYYGLGTVRSSYESNSSTETQLEMITFRIEATCDGDPRIKSNWSYKLIGDTNIVSNSQEE